MTTIDVSNNHQWPLPVCERLIGNFVVDGSGWQYLYPLVLVLYLCHNKYHKFSNLKQHKFNISQFYRWEGWVNLTGFSAPDFRRSKWSFQPTWALNWEALGRICSHTHSGFDRKKFLVAVVLRSLFLTGCQQRLPLAPKDPNSPSVIKHLLQTALGLQWEKKLFSV